MLLEYALEQDSPVLVEVRKRGGSAGGPWPGGVPTLEVREGTLEREI